jgi:NTE family protein
MRIKKSFSCLVISHPKKVWAFMAFLLLINVVSLAGNPPKGKLGLTLSGGGAKGFAHIGVLHVIDSLGLKVDYITGTSMGSIVGGLYASGYSASEVEEFALSVDWANVFNAKPELTNIHIRGRSQSGKSLIEVPFEGLKFVIGTGAIEGHQLWTLLEQLFFHLRETDDFNDFPFPFACVATDMETGSPVVLSYGDIVSALRASMAIPAVFSSVDRNGKRLVDGGVVNNYPVDVVKNMGATYVIGVSVSSGLKKADELKTPVDIIYQMGFFKDAYMFEQNLRMTDLFIEPDLEGYEASSFTSIAEIIERGKQMARTFIPEFEALAKIYPSAGFKPEIPDRVDFIVIDQVEYRGLNLIRESYVRNFARISEHDTLSVDKINQTIRRLYATGYFDRINYTYKTSDKDPVKKHLIYHFTEKPLNRLKLGLHYNSFMGVGLIGGISTSKLFIYNLNGDFSFRLGDQAAYRAVVDFFVSENQHNWVSLKAEGFGLEFPYNEDFTPVAAYKQRYNRFETTFNKLAGNSSYFFAGAAKYLQSLKPTIKTDYAVSGKNEGYELFAGYKKYSLDRHVFTRSGQHLSLSASYFLGQKPSIKVITEDETITDLSQIGIAIDEFVQLKFSYKYYLPITRRSSYFASFQAGYNFNYTQGFLNMFNLGGTFPFLRDQFYFAGLGEYDIITPALLTAGLGWNFNVWSDFYLIPKVNAALYDFDIEKLTDIGSNNMLLGAGLSLGYLTPVGPLKATVSYSPQSNEVLGYINLGWNF